MIEVKQSQPPRNGCYNREPFRESLTVQDGWMCGVRRMVVIPFRNSMDCQYSKDTPDHRCAGCKWNQREKQSCTK